MGNSSGALLHVWRAQGWYVNMFEIESHDVEHAAMTFAKQNGHVKGGWQGGRGWQVNADKINSTNGDYLLAGGWMIEGALELLDAPNEYFFDAATRTLYVWPNNTAVNGPSPAELNVTYVATQLHSLIVLNATKDAPILDVTISGINFRDAADIAMLPWGVPSGGDWGMSRWYHMGEVLCIGYIYILCISLCHVYF